MSLSLYAYKSFRLHIDPNLPKPTTAVQYTQVDGVGRRIDFYCTSVLVRAYSSRGPQRSICMEMHRYHETLSSLGSHFCFAFSIVSFTRAANITCAAAIVSSQTDDDVFTSHTHNCLLVFCKIVFLSLHLSLDLKINHQFLFFFFKFFFFNCNA